MAKWSEILRRLERWEENGKGIMTWLDGQKQEGDQIDGK